MPDLEGKTLDRYNLQRLMGKGGMADVYLGSDSHFNREVAVKVFKREDENLLRRFIREAHLMASLSNAHLMSIYDAGTAMLEGSNIYYIVMPFMRGGTLRAHIRNNPISPSEACRYLSNIADALDYMHGQGIIHRDIKSSNILLDENGHCYLSDFGIARASTDATQMTSTGNIMGTVDYLAPELVETDQRANVRSDLYSLGILLFEMVTGVLPFRGENQIAVIAMHVSKRPPSPRSIVPTLSRGVERVIYKALEKRPEQRYESATKLAEAFCHAAKQPFPDEQLAEPSWNQATVAISDGSIQDTQHFMQVKEMAVSSPITGSPAAKSTSMYSEGALSRPLLYVPTSNRKRRSPARTRMIIATTMAALALLAVLIPAVYVMATQSARQAADRAHALATSQAMHILAATARSEVNVMATLQANATATSQANATATSQANATATATAQANATATAQANATAAAQANAIASATASVIQAATSGSLIYSDPFSNPQDGNQISGWDDRQNACTFQQDGYYVMAKFTVASGLQGCYQSGQQFQDFTVKVDMRIASGQSGGIFLRANNQGLDSGYLFEVDSKGNYRLSSSPDFTKGRATLLDWTASPVLNKGVNVTNTLEVIVQGNSLKLYANGGFLATVQDTTFPDAGYIGLQASTDNQDQNADVVYTNLNVYQA